MHLPALNSFIWSLWLWEQYEKEDLFHYSPYVLHNLSSLGLLSLLSDMETTQFLMRLFFFVFFLEEDLTITLIVVYYVENSI